MQVVMRMATAIVLMYGSLLLFCRDTHTPQLPILRVLIPLYPRYEGLQQPSRVRTGRAK